MQNSAILLINLCKTWLKTQAVKALQLDVHLR